MIAPLAKFIDWSALQFAAMLPSIRKCARGDSKLTKAIEFLNGPDFIPAVPAPVSENRGRSMVSAIVHFDVTGKSFAPPRLCVKALFAD